MITHRTCWGTFKIALYTIITLLLILVLLQTLRTLNMIHSNMLLTRFNLIRLITIRSISIDAPCLGQTNIKQVKMLKKIMAGREKGKRRWVYNENIPKMENPMKLSSTLKQGKEANRRVTVLNKMFMKNVTDLMATGDFAEKLYGYGLQILAVKVADDFKKMNILWVASNMERDGEIERILKSVAGPLRHELSILRLMGEVPQINFVKDKRYIKTAEVDAILKKADFGEDFVPSDSTLFRKNDYKLEMKFPDDIKAKIKELDDIDEDIGEELPPMRHDIFGLDHARLMNKIVVSMDKSKQAWESFEKGHENPVSQMDIKITKESALGSIEKLTKEAEMRDNFAEYIQAKNSKKFSPERKKYRNFINDDQQEDAFEYHDQIPDNDYIIEDEDYKK